VSANHTVLVVEDDDEVRASLVEAIADQGYGIVEARNGREALDRLAQAKPCVVLLDLMMPVMDGWEFLDRMHQDPSNDNIPVCVVTALPDQAPTNATSVLAKPVRLERVIGVLEQYC
jgi:CheY-like chemotaxis protein